MTIGETISLSVCVVYLCAGGISMCVSSRWKDHLISRYNSGPDLERAMAWLRGTAVLCFAFAALTVVLMICCHITKLTVFAWLCYGMVVLAAIVLVVMRFTKFRW